MLCRGYVMPHKLLRCEPSQIDMSSACIYIYLHHVCRYGLTVAVLKTSQICHRHSLSTEPNSKPQLLVDHPIYAVMAHAQGTSWACAHAAHQQEEGSAGQCPAGGRARLLAGQAAVAVAPRQPASRALPHAAAGRGGNGHRPAPAVAAAGT